MERRNLHRTTLPSFVWLSDWSRHLHNQTLFGGDMNVCLWGCASPFEDVPGNSGRPKATLLPEPVCTFSTHIDSSLICYAQVPLIHLIPPSPSNEQTFSGSSSFTESSHRQASDDMSPVITHSRPDSSWTQRISGFFDPSKLSFNLRTAPRHEASSVYLAPHPDLPEDPFASRIDMAALSPEIGPLRDISKEYGPLAAAIKECHVETRNDEEKVAVKEEQDPVQPGNQMPVGQSHKVADPIGHLSKEKLPKDP